MDDRERDLAATVDELAETLESLRTELREPPRGPLGLPRPPTPGEFLRFTERYAIPATISLLEASIRTLELLAAAIRVADGRPLDGESTVRREATAAGTDRIASASRRTLGALDDALAELQSAAAGGEVENPELQRLLSEARELRDEVDDRLAESTAAGTGAAGDAEPVDIEVQMGEDESAAGEGDASDDDGVDVDVDRELESIKREFDESEGDGPGEGSEASVDDPGVRHDEPADDPRADETTDAGGDTDRGEETGAVDGGAGDADDDADGGADGDDGPETGDGAEGDGAR